MSTKALSCLGLLALAVANTSASRQADDDPLQAARAAAEAQDLEPAGYKKYHKGSKYSHHKSDDSHYDHKKEAKKPYHVEDERYHHPEGDHPNYEAERPYYEDTPNYYYKKHEKDGNWPWVNPLPTHLLCAPSVPPT